MLMTSQGIGCKGGAHHHGDLMTGSPKVYFHIP